MNAPRDTAVVPARDAAGGLAVPSGGERGLGRRDAAGDGGEKLAGATLAAGPSGSFLEDIRRARDQLARAGIRVSYDDWVHENSDPDECECSRCRDRAASQANAGAPDRAGIPPNADDLRRERAALDASEPDGHPGGICGRATCEHCRDIVLDLRARAIAATVRQPTLDLVPAARPVGDVVPARGGPQRAVRGTADIVITVKGTPAPKGSMRAMLRNGQAVLVPSGSAANARKLHAWNLAVREAALEAIGASKNILGEPKLQGVALDVTIVFWLARPKSHYGRRGDLLPSAPKFPIAKREGDSDKHARAVCDSLTGVVWDDDSRVVDLHSSKRYATRGDEGATIVVREVV